ncbi:hypothetical protein MUN74_01680 [Agromyces endophyticus]|uniref:glycosyltransferase n=1 Tax=Agromyces sp. H17E-10 TaxID=2932244 RepID=UPI001FD21912|nr:nucleotide disphospho-sugar-binding domain-containing protein [Agromyces sp. H17E-10]UOQ89656.1 hypothetical protein MUN74_01680 [Agromyces sp. H17E-10]
MGTFAIVTVDAGGNVPPALTIAAELARRGHTAHVLAHERLRERVTAAGLPFVELESLRDWTAVEPHGAVGMLRAYTRLASSPAVEREVGERLAGLGADASLVDCLMAGCGRASRAAGVPDVVLFHTLLAYWLGGYARGPVGAVAGLRGTAPSRAWRAAAARIVASDAALDPAARSGHEASAFDWTGAVETGRPAERDPARPPLVVASLSSTWLPGQSAAYQRIATALGALPVRGLITLGGLELDRPLDLPSNVELVDRADHGEVLSRTAVLIGHGGHSTTLRALAHDVPVVALPMHPFVDQPMVASAVEAAGAGIRLPKTASADRIAGAVTRALTDEAMRAAAAGIGARIRSVDAAAAACTLLERVAAARARAH